MCVENHKIFLTNRKDAWKKYKRKIKYKIGMLKNMSRTQTGNIKTSLLANLLTIRDVDGVALFLVFIVFISSGHLEGK